MSVEQSLDSAVPRSGRGAAGPRRFDVKGAGRAVRAEPPAPQSRSALFLSSSVLPHEKPAGSENIKLANVPFRTCVKSKNRVSL